MGCTTGCTELFSIASTVSTTSLEPIAANLSCKAPALSVGSISTLCCKSISPVSISCFSRNVVTPVRVSPSIIARFIGAAPLYCGSSEACRLTVPNLGIFHTASGNIRKATTICKSAPKALSVSMKSSSLRLVGCNRGNLFSKANSLTGENRTFCPRPTGLSGTVTTATICLPLSKSAFSGYTANSGVPI